MERILIVEDNLEYIEFLKKLLEANGYAVESATSSIAGIEFIAREKFDLLISDLNLKVLDGIALLTSARKIDPSIRTIILTANPSKNTELEALRLEADLYLEKDKGIDLILLYIKKLLDDKSYNVNQRQFELVSESENITLNVRDHEVRKDNESINLSPKEFELLKLFLENKSSVLTRYDIIKTVWASEKLLESTRIVDVHIQKLREKLNTFSIATVRGIGYKWNE